MRYDTQAINWNLPPMLFKGRADHLVRHLQEDRFSGVPQGDDGVEDRTGLIAAPVRFAGDKPREGSKCHEGLTPIKSPIKSPRWTRPA